MKRVYSPYQGRWISAPDPFVSPEDCDHQSSGDACSQCCPCDMCYLDRAESVAPEYHTALSDMIQAVTDEWSRTIEQNVNPTREDFFADAGRWLSEIAGPEFD